MITHCDCWMRVRLGHDALCTAKQVRSYRQDSAVLHARDYTVIVPTENLPKLADKLHLAFDYEETLGTTTYRHYEVWGVKR